MNVNDFAQDWYRFAKMDSDAAYTLFDKMYPQPFEIICYHAQQSAEKLLKGFLVGNDIDPPKTHDLRLLNDMCVEIDERFIALEKMLSILSRYGVQPRYPRELEVTEKDTIQALKFLDSITAFFKEHIFEKLSADTEQ